MLKNEWHPPRPGKLTKAIAETAKSKTVPPPRRDPLVFDLDGDGVETVAVGAGVLFDHNSDNIATGTGWVKSDDGLLVRDINNNGTIDSGRELFGDRTLLSNGAQAANGFAALRDLDSNADGKIDSSDAAFGELEIWRDLNQDGFSQADELISLADAGIAAINLDAVAKNQAQNGNTIASTGSYTKTDGSTGTTADVNLASDPSNRRFTDTVEIPETILDLPDMTGSGRVRDLQEAAALSPTLADILTRFSSAATRAEQLALLDELLLAWADTSGMAGSLEERDPRYRVEYLSFGNVRRSDHITGTTTAGTVTTAPTNTDNPHIDTTYRNLINQWNDKVHILEAFNGSYFFGLPGQPQDGGAAAIGMWVDYSGSTALSGANRGKPGLAINFDQRQLDLLGSAYQSLREAVYDTLVVQTRLQGYLDNIREEIVVPEGIETDDVAVILDFSAVTQSFQDKLAVDPVNGLTDLIEFNRYTRELLSGTQWDGAAMMEETIRTLPATPELQAVYSDFGVRFNGAAGTGNDDIILGDGQGRTIYGSGGSDTLLGGASNETLVGGAGNDTISGGAGNDHLLGEAGDDTYIFRRGSGNDTITDGQGNNSVHFSGLNPGDIRVTASNLPYDDLLFTIVDTGETLTIASVWTMNWSSYELSSIGSFIFADGTVWSKEDALRAAVELPTEGNDRIIGSRLSDAISGLGGNDTIIGRDGDDTMDGGSGDDLLIGSANFYRDYTTGQQRYYETVAANGNDTYLFGRGSGHDTILDGDNTPNTDTLRFAEDVAPDDVTIDRDGDNLVLTIGDTGDSVTIARYFYENVYTGLGHTFEIENIDFADGTRWTAASIRELLLAGSDADDTIVGYRADDVITGRGGDDAIDARGGNDLISGGDGNDTIYAGTGNDLIDGGAGDDCINGSNSRYYDGGYLDNAPQDNDTYIFGYGSGHDTICDYDWRGGNSDTIRFSEGVTADAVSFSRTGTDLLIVLGSGSDSITVKGWFGYGSNYYKIERLEFTDGTLLGPDAVEARLTIDGTDGDDSILGSASGETIRGHDGSDKIFGGWGNDTLDGGEGSDRISGDQGNDTLIGAGGDDWLEGGEGDDTYRFGRGYGRDTAYERFDGYYYAQPSTDVVAFCDDILPTDVTVRRHGDDMVLSINGSEDILTVKKAFSETYVFDRVEEVRFANGEIWDFATMQQRALLATDGDDVIEGTPSGDVMDGGSGNDRLMGGSGSDTYWFGRGYGSDVIEEEMRLVDVDTVQFLPGIASNDVVFSRDGNDLLVRINDSADSLRIMNSTGIIEQFIFDDGTVLTRSDVDMIIGTPVFGETIVGTFNGDTITGTALNSTILGLEGDDMLDGGAGNDNISGGGGNDLIDGGDGDDYLKGDDGNDILAGGAGRDTLFGGAGTNIYRYERGGGLDFVNAVVSDGVDDTVEFGTGITPADLQVQVDARYYMYDPQPTDIGYRKLVIGIGGDDAIEIKNADLSDIGRSPVRRFRFADDTEMTLEQIVALADGGVAGSQWGSDFDDSLTGSNADDDICGNNGDDRLKGRDNDDWLEGGNGNDVISGDSGNDNLRGGNGNDVLAGGTGDDYISGGAGDDAYLFNRGDGNDYINQHWNDSGVKTLSFGVGIAPGDLSAYLNAEGDLVILVDSGTGGSVTAPWYNMDDWSENSILPLHRIQFIDGDGRATLLDLVSLVRSQSSALANSDKAHPVPIFANAEAYDITLSTLPSGGDPAVSYAQNGDVFAAPHYNSVSSGTDNDDIVFGTQGNDTLNGGAGNDLIIAFDGDDYLEGASGRDRIDGGGGNDDIYGGDGDDVLYGGDGYDLIHAGPGNDLAVGGYGSDTYLFNAGDGSLTIEDYYLDSSIDSGGYGGEVIGYYDGYGGDYGGVPAVNVLRFGPGIAFSDLRFSVSEGYLIIDIPTTGDRLRIAGYDPSRPTLTTAIDIFSFSDGFEPEQEDILDLGISFAAPTDEGATIAGTAGIDIITGGMGDDILNGGRGSDRLIGGNGNDIYQFNLGDGRDTIVDISTPGMENSIMFGDGIMPWDIRVEVEEGTLVIRVGNGGDAIRFEGYNPDIPGMPLPVANLTFTDGTQRSLAGLLAERGGIVGTSISDTLVGTTGDDYIFGLGDNDLLIGGDGDDTYYFDDGDGVDTINDISRPGEWNSVVLPEGLSHSDLQITHDPENRVLIIKIRDTDDEIRLTGFDRLDPFGSRAVQFIRFGEEGSALSYDDLLSQGFEIEGTSGNDTLLGTATHDYIYGDEGNDLLIGGAGNDYLEGGAGDDTYIFNQGDGIVTISDYQEEGCGNTLKFGPGIVPDDLSHHLRFAPPEDTDKGAGLLIIAFDNGDELRIEGLNPSDLDNSSRSVERFSFDDGTTLSFAELVRYTFVVEGDNDHNLLSGTNLGDRLYGYDGADELNSGSGDDVLTGGTGDDVLWGGGGRDAYVFNLGDGNDTVIDIAENGIGNVITFGSGIDPGDVGFELNGTSLTIRYGALGDTVRIENFDPTGASGSLVIDTFEFSDGRTFSYRELTNSAPTAQGLLSDLTATEDQPFVFQLQESAFSDADGDLLTYRVEASGYDMPPSWLVFDPATRTLSGTPGNADVGSFTLTVSAIDPLGAMASHTVTLTVNNVNDAPVVASSLADQSATEDEPFSYQIPSGTFVDIDAGDQLSYAATLANGDPLPSWLQFDAATGTFSGTPGNSEAGDIGVMVRATDLSGAVAESSFIVTVENVNDAPVVASSLADQSATEGEPFNFQIPSGTFVDIDAGDQLRYAATLANGDPLPSWLQFDAATGTFSGTPGNSEVGDIGVIVRATDLSGAVAESSFIVTVENVNDAPVVASSLADQSATEDEPFSFQIPSGTFVDIDAGDQLSYAATLANGDPLPSWLQFDAATGTFSGIPGNSEVGDIGVMVRATDLSGAVAESSFIVTVENVNDAPVVASSLADQSATEGEQFNFQIPSGTFVDIDAGDQLRYAATLANGDPLPAWLQFDAVTGTFSGTPLSGSASTIDIRVSVSDQAGLSVDDTFLLVTAPPPIIVGTAGNDILTGSVGNDTLDGRGGCDTLLAGAGDDTLVFSPDYAAGLFDVAINVGSPGVWGSFAVEFINGKKMSYDLYDGGEDFDTLVGTDSDDAIFLDRGLLCQGPNIAGVERIMTGAGNDLIDLTSYRYGYGDTILDGGSGNDVLWASSGNDLLSGGSGSDKMDGGAGNDILQGGADNDYLRGWTGKNLLDGGTGADILLGGSGNEQFIGGTGNDIIETGSGADIISFNRGDGSDCVYGNIGTDNVLSLGGGIKYSDLSFRKSGFDLVLDAAGGDTVTLKGWYYSSCNRSVLTLQMIEEAAEDFNPGGDDLLRDNKVEKFNFAGLADKFDQALAANPCLTSWSLSSALTQFHLGGSDTEAIGGDLAYQYGKNGDLGGIGLAAAQDLLAQPQFGTAPQALKTLSGLQEGAVMLG